MRQPAAGGQPDCSFRTLRSAIALVTPTFKSIFLSSRLSAASSNDGNPVFVVPKSASLGAPESSPRAGFSSSAVGGWSAVIELVWVGGASGTSQAR